SPIVQDVVRDILKNSNLDDKLVVLPLYPQYSSSTTGSIVDAVNSVVAETKRIIDYKVINSYYANPAYIKALAEKIKSYYDFESTLIFSYHGIPLSYGMNGDYYYQHCLRTTELVAKKLKLDKSQYKMVFQSQFGKAKWLEPAILDVLDDLSKNGNKKVTVVCPGFSADCLETLEEINKQDREIFISNGGLEFTYVPALNIDDAHIDLLTNVILNNINLSK
ncbi:MAG: ferrochelatase, partial [Psittacicella sp.]